MSNFQNTVRKEPLKPSGKLVSFFVQPARSSEAGPFCKNPQNSGQTHISELIPQGKSLNISKKPQILHKPDHSKPLTSETDERYQYLMKKGIIKRVEKDEKIIFAELPGLAGVLVVYRSPAERSSNPERLNLDRRDLTQMPLLEGEERLRLLNYQQNQITKIENLLSLPNLIFLDLYNNQIKEINGLHTVPGLRVLMLGKNLIEKIRNLNSLVKLDVLDLHSNQIVKIENLAGLAELRVLNLANNAILAIEGLDSLKSLSEVNLRRNEIQVIKAVSGLNKLQRLFLSNNRLEKIADVEILTNCVALTELALDGNPIQNLLNYTANVLMICKNLSIFDMKKVTQDMKENAIRNQKISEESYPTESLVLSIQTEWKNEVERLRGYGLNFFRRRKEMPGECLVLSGHAEIENESILFIYGNALEAISKTEFHESVLSLHLNFVRFDYIVQNSCIGRLRKFVNLKKIYLNENNLHSYIHLSKLEAISSLVSMSIEKNDIVFTTVYRSFIVYRFPSLIEINGLKVTDEDKNIARQQFQNFDKVLCNPTIFTTFNQKFTHEDDKEAQKNLRINSKKNVEFAGEYIKKIINLTIQNEKKISSLNEYWNNFYSTICKVTLIELVNPKSISESSLHNFK